VPASELNLGKNSFGKTSAAAVLYTKKSYHSTAVPMKLAKATCRMDLRSPLRAVENGIVRSRKYRMPPEIVLRFSTLLSLAAPNQRMHAAGARAISKAAARRNPTLRAGRSESKSGYQLIREGLLTGMKGGGRGGNPGRDPLVNSPTKIAFATVRGCDQLSRFTKNSGATQACKNLVDVFDRHDFKQNSFAPRTRHPRRSLPDGSTQRMSGLHDRLDGLRIGRQTSLED
jgi:hypothetical protein